MHNNTHPVLHPVRLDTLRPTQMTVGLREVRRKRDDWARLRSHKEAAFLGTHMIPVVLGPKGRTHIIDNHHLARALHDEGVTEVLVRPMADLGRFSADEFWMFLANRNWLHLYDGAGAACAIKELPKTIAAMKDDPYRSLAGDLRRAGGYAKDATPYSEFLWADFLRRRIRAKLLADNYQSAVAKALVLARDRQADHLPGWCGPED